MMTGFEDLERYVVAKLKGGMKPTYVVLYGKEFEYERIWWFENTDADCWEFVKAFVQRKEADDFCAAMNLMVGNERPVINYFSISRTAVYGKTTVSADSK